MLQYSVQPVFSSPIVDNSDYFPRNDRLNHKRSPKEPFVSRAAFPGPPPPITTNLSSSPALSALSTSSSKLPRSPYISSRQTSSPVDLPSARLQSNSHSRPPSIASEIDDVLCPGDVVAEGQPLQNENIRLVPIPTDKPPLPEEEEPAGEFEVIRRLGAGSYAVVYLVREVLYRAAPSYDGHITVGDMDDRPRLNNVYGREYAIKCLSKANLDQDALAAQMSEVTIHQSLRSHPNIVTHHRTYETSSFLLLLLEYVPGEDLFYFLEQARDHYDNDSDSTESSSTLARTPPTPSLLSNLNPSQLLSRTRLRLISSMFSQMCDAVADCHSQNVFHRDIKPENFIVTDAWLTDDDGRRERKVVVKLTDFGLSTTDVESSDMDCGSAPYMSYECRNNIAPTYRPRAADVWSLGIVLINMLYHYNPWTDTAVGSCSSFDLYRQNPVTFFMARFAGMTRPVAELLANRVFNILDDAHDDSARITASDFGTWAKDLPDLLCDQPGSAHFGHKRVVSVSSTGYPISSTQVSHRPSSRQASTAIQRRPSHSRTHSRAPSLAFERPDVPELSTVFDQDVEEEQDAEEQETEIVVEGMTSRSTSTNKRRKRGARKGKGLSATTPTTPKDETLDTLASASQSLAREISRASKASSKKSNPSTTDSARARRGPQHFEPVSMYAVPTAMFTNTGVGTAPPVPPLPPAARPAPVTKKPSKWKLSFGKASAATVAASVKEQSSAPAKVDVGTATVSQASGEKPMSATASNVTTLIMGLSPPPATPVQTSTTSNDALSATWGRGRHPIGSFTTGRVVPGPSPNPSVEKFEKVFGHTRGSSPHSTRSGRPLASSSSSMASSANSNWRNSTSSAGTSSSAFTHYSNSSLKSVSSAATSVSAGSWRSKQAGPQPHSPNSPTAYRPPGLPKNVKMMDGVPWELSGLPRGQHPDPVGDIFGQPPPRKPRGRKPQDLKLDTITEGTGSPRKSPTAQRHDASTSTTDLDDVDGDWQNKKVQKGQIHTLAKILSAIRR